jgi:hypothetical protein
VEQARAWRGVQENGRETGRSAGRFDREGAPPATGAPSAPRGAGFPLPASLGTYNFVAEGSKTEILAKTAPARAPRN